MNKPRIPFNKPYLTGGELGNIQRAAENGQLAGDGDFTKLCSRRLAEMHGSSSVFLTHSCTAALEMSAILAGVSPGDEVIMPSYTFVSSANAFVLRGAVPVFVDIRRDTLNIDETKIEKAISSRTKAIVPVHYAGVPCEMDRIMSIANDNRLVVIEDAAQGICAAYKGKPLGSIAPLGCLSFHETKNIISGEGGALLVNDDRLAERAEIIREKGTNRSRFFRGEVDKYTWEDMGSSYLPGELISAFLWAQLESATQIQEVRHQIWNQYNDAFAELEAEGRVRRPVLPPDTVHNAHMYYLLLRDSADRAEFISHLNRNGVKAVFHYVPLHSSPAGQRYGRTSGSMTMTDELSGRLVRLPMWINLGAAQDVVIEACKSFFRLHP